MVCGIHDQVLAHDGQTDEAEITTGIDPRKSADIDAGETGATVSASIYQQSPSRLQPKESGGIWSETRSLGGGVMGSRRIRKAKLTLLFPSS